MRELGLRQGKASDEEGSRLLNRFSVGRVILLVLIVTVGSFATSPSTAQGSPIVVGANIPIISDVPPDRQQVEPTIAVDPRNPSIIVAGAQDYRLLAAGGHRWHGYYRSSDGGSTWSQGLLPGFLGDSSPQGISSPLHRSNATSDPVLAFDRSGNVYYAGLIFNITATGISGITAFVAKYTDDGANYSNVTLIRGVRDADKPWIAVDNTNGPNDGNVYLAFDATIGNDFATVFTRSTDGGNTFSAPFFTPSDKTGELPGVAVDPAGNVYVSTDAFDNVTGKALNYTQVSKLTNGGTILGANVRAANPVTNLPSPLPGGSFRTFTIPQIAADSQGVYVVFDDFRTGNSDVLLTKSTNGGMTWTLPARVNDVTTGHQFFPTIATSGGIISVAWLDSRFNTGATLTALDLFYAQSTDGGVTFSSSVRLTSVSFNPELVKRTDAPNFNEPFIGDYIGISSSPTMAHAIWADNRNACDTMDPTYGCVDQDAFTVAITVTPPQPIHDVSVDGLAKTRDFAYNGVPANPVKVNVTAVNLGSTSETFTVTFKANLTIIGSQSVTLLAGTSIVISLGWHPEQTPRGAYTLAATATSVIGENNLANNVASDGTITVRFAGDMNGDCKVTILDIAIMAFAFDSTPTSHNWNPNADMDNNGIVNILDIAGAALNFDKSCSP